MSIADKWGVETGETEPRKLSLEYVEASLFYNCGISPTSFAKLDGKQLPTDEDTTPEFIIKTVERAEGQFPYISLVTDEEEYITSIPEEKFNYFQYLLEQEHGTLEYKTVEEIKQKSLDEQKAKVKDMTTDVNSLVAKMFGAAGLGPDDYGFGNSDDDLDDEEFYGDDE